MSYMPRTDLTEEQEELSERVCDALATVWEALTRQHTYAHQWSAHADRIVTEGPLEDG